MAHNYNSYLFKSPNLLPEPEIITSLGDGRFFIRGLTDAISEVIQLAYENKFLLYGGTRGNNFHHFIELIILEYNMPSLNFLKPPSLYGGGLYSIVYPYQLSKLIEDLKSLLVLCAKFPRKTLRMCLYADENNVSPKEDPQSHFELMEHLNNIPDECFFTTEKDILELLKKPMIPLNEPQSDQISTEHFAFSYIKSILYIAEIAKEEKEYLIFLQDYGA